MLPFVKVYLAVVIALSFTAVHFTLPPARQRPSTVLDYYLLLPAGYLQLEGVDSRDARESAISVKDLENGFLQIRQQVGEVYTALKIFKKPDGNDIVAIEKRSCIAGCFSKVTLLLYEKDQWVDVTSEKLPVMDDITVKGILKNQISSREENLADFNPRILYTLPRKGSIFEVSEHWSGMKLGEMELEDGRFVFSVGSSPELIKSDAVLASVSNADGDRLQIIGLNPELPIKLPIKGHVRVRLAYELASAKGCFIWVSPIASEKSSLDYFTAGSMLHKQGSGIKVPYFGFNNQTHIDQLKVVMVDDHQKELLRLIYKVNADWEGVLECPKFRVACVSNSHNSAIPTRCIVYSTGVQPGQQLSYQWTILGGSIVSGQGTRLVKIETFGQENVTASVEVGGLGGTCATNASFVSTAATVGRPSR